jgi:protein-S-isoprenylcysteine O-methyltransferase Ste14
MSAGARATGARLPALGSRGEGWVALQAALFLLVAAAGLAGPAWAGDARLAGVAAGAGLIAAGVALVAAGIARLRRHLTAFPRPVSDGELVTDGAFALVRHPMYGGAVIAAAGWALATASAPAIAASAALGVFFDLKSRREEAWLFERFAGYEAYARSTRRMIPFLH